MTASVKLEVQIDLEQTQFPFAISLSEIEDFDRVHKVCIISLPTIDDQLVQFVLAECYGRFYAGLAELQVAENSICKLPKSENLDLCGRLAVIIYPTNESQSIM